MGKFLTHYKFYSGQEVPSLYLDNTVRKFASTLL